METITDKEAKNVGGMNSITVINDLDFHKVSNLSTNKGFYYQYGF